jgi:hypothetical protein
MSRFRRIQQDEADVVADCFPPITSHLSHLTNKISEAVEKWQLCREHLSPRGGEIEEPSAIDFREFLFTA